MKYRQYRYKYKGFSIVQDWAKLTLKRRPTWKVLDQSGTEMEAEACTLQEARDWINDHLES